VGLRVELLIVGCIAFLVFHLGISGTRLRSILQDRLGADVYLGVYSVVSLAAFGLMIYGYSQVSEADVVWYGTPNLIKLTKVMVLMAIVLMVMGLMTPNPTMVKAEFALANEITGMLKITRHPVQWGILLFAIAHLIVNGDVASLWLFGTLATLSFVGMFSMDARRRRETDPRWQSFMAQTSMMPFAAVAAGRQKLLASDINWMGLGVGVALYALIYFFHDSVSGGVSLI